MPWQTPSDPKNTSRRQEGAEHREDMLPRQASNWPTPNTCDRGPEMRDKKDARGSGGADLQTWAQNWSTPTSAVATGGAPQDSKQKRDLRLDIANWPTPGANDHKGTAKLGQRRGQLDEAAEQKWHTPMGNDKDIPYMTRNGKKIQVLVGQAQSLCSLQDPATSTPGKASSQSVPNLLPRLNPRFVAWLMGLPPWWTET